MATCRALRNDLTVFDEVTFLEKEGDLALVGKAEGTGEEGKVLFVITMVLSASVDEEGWASVNLTRTLCVSS